MHNMGAPLLVARVFHNVVRFAAEGSLLVVVTADNPRGLRVYEDNYEKAFFIKTRNEELFQFASKAKIVVINKQYTLFYDRSQAKLLNTNKRYFDEISVGAEMMYFEDPYLLALDGTTFTKYDLDGNALQRYKFEDAVRVFPDNRWSSFALHHSHYLTCDAHIQYVSRRVGQELEIVSQVLVHILPTVLLKMVKSYIQDFVPEIPKSTSGVFATLTSIRTRQVDDLASWKPQKAITSGIYTTYVAEAEVFISGGKFKAPKKIDFVSNHNTLDFAFLTQGIVVLSEPPLSKLYVRYVDTDTILESFLLGIKDPRSAGFYRDDKGLLHLMVLTDTMTYDYIIGYQDTPKNIGIVG